MVTLLRSVLAVSAVLLYIEAKLRKQRKYNTLPEDEIWGLLLPKQTHIKHIIANLFVS